MSRISNEKMRLAAAQVGKARAQGKVAAQQGKEYTDCPYQNLTLRQHWYEAFGLERARIMELYARKQRAGILKQLV